ncbi:ABC transporter permease [Variovorax sp. DXTD-1]|uniref:ABC transporter permease n=1 Tax=Variovorax sp. DXTD-1 TaxID=2495592 RepID=UPI000F889241|nr:ABC transporter permease [Variovorax sp. DXTD-1]RST48070.1 ABC transporter permease [Variovorax sp. DXTD-1]
MAAPRTFFLHRLAASGGAPAAFVLLIVMFCIYAMHEPSALSMLGIGNLLNNMIVLALAASGLTIVILCGELDLSGPGVLAISNVTTAMLATGAFGPFGGLASVLVIGALIGGLNGMLVAYLGQQSIAATLGVLIVCQGIALLILSAPGGAVPDAMVELLTGDIAGIPTPALMLALVAVLWFLLKFSRTGISIYAVGADKAAARLSGLNVETTKLFAFVVAGVCYALAGFVHGAQIGSGDPRVSDSFLLFIFASVAIGGASLNGGRGGVIGTLVGAAILTVLQKMLFALGVADFYTNIFNGAVMVLAIYFGRLSALWGGLRNGGKA